MLWIDLERSVSWAREIRSTWSAPLKHPDVWKIGMLEQFLTDFWEPTNHPRAGEAEIPKRCCFWLRRRAIPSSFTVSMRLFVSNRFFGQFGRFVTMFKINPSKQCLKGQKWSYSEEHHPGLECCGCRLIISVVSKRKEHLGDPPCVEFWNGFGGTLDISWL